VGEDPARWLVDGMNLIGSRPDGWWRDRPAARRALVGRLGAFRARTGEAVTVVFDGHHDERAVADGAACEVEVLFAPGGPDAADGVIARLAGDGATETTVVTSDRRLAEEVSGHGVTVVGVRAFGSLLDGTAPGG